MYPVSLSELLIRTDVSFMSTKLFGVPYSDLKELIYPLPPYKSFTIKKRNGAPRFIHEPRQGLKVLQEQVLAYLYKNAGPAMPCVHGFTPARSIVTNAKKHCSPKTQHLLNIDIEDFFPSITFYRVRGLLQQKPFKCSYRVATVLAHLCTFNGTLPQGSPTSPLLANLVCRGLDGDLMKLAKRHRATYTRYADDITFSFSVRRSDALPANICSFDSGILTLGEELRAIFATHTFRINPNKSRLSTRLHRLEVTGVTINQHPNVKRAFIDSIRGALHAWGKYGYDLAETEWGNKIKGAPSQPYEKRPWKRQTRRGNLPALKNVLWGRLLYVRMVRGADDLLYRRLAKRFNALREREQEKGGFVCSSLPVDAIVRNITEAKDALFVIEWEGMYKMPSGTFELVGSQGTAFAYKDVGLVTCSHVLSFEEDIADKHVETDFQSEDVVHATLTITNPVAGKSWKGKVVYRDKDHDIAIIQFDSSARPQHHYFIGMNSPIQINEVGILAGFPNHSAAKQADLLTERVLNRYARFGLDRFDITGAGSIRQGNSGGPFLDESYQVAGVAQKGAKQDGGDDQCLCVTALDKLLHKWKSTPVSGTIVPASASPYPALTAPVPAPAITAPISAGLSTSPVEPEVTSIISRLSRSLATKFG
jgi:RNA-directed DNA polymerase